MKAKNTQKKLEDMGSGMVSQLRKGEGPTFETTLRTRSNTFYDESAGCLRTGEKKEVRKFLSVAQAKTFMQTVAIAAKTKQFLSEDLHTSIRGLFYQLKFTLGEDIDEDLFTEQAESNALVEDLEVALNVKREDLHLTTDRKGFVAGPMKIRDKFGGEETIIDLEKQGRSGWSIPSDVDNGMDITGLDADYVLCLPEDEKLAVIDDGRLNIKSIESVYNSLEKKNRDIQVISYNEKYKTCKGHLLAISKRKARPGEKVVTIITKSGSEINVSDNHKIPVLRSEGIAIIAAKDVKKDDFLLEAKKIKIKLKQREHFDLIELLERELRAQNAYIMGASELITDKTAAKLGLTISKTVDGKDYSYPYQYLADGWKQRNSLPLKHYLSLEKSKEKRKKLRIKFSGSKKKDGVKCIIKVDTSLARLMGYYLAEGHLHRYQVGFSFGKKEIQYQKEVCELIERIFGVKPVIYRHSGEVQIFAQNKAIALFFKGLNLGENSHEKRIPPFVFGMCDEFITNLLECYLHGDGYAKSESYRSTTVSKHLHHGLNLLFRKIGVPTYVGKIKGRRTFGKYYGLDSYSLDIVRKYFDGKDSEKSRHLWERYPLFLVGDYKDRNIRSYLQLNYTTINKSLLSKVNNREVKKWLKADVHPVKVRKVKTRNYDREFYELVAVSPNHIFMHASGLFTHNCVEKDALWQRLNEDKFWKKENCLLVTPKGQSTRGTRRLLRKLADNKLPVYCLMDCDAWGWYIYWTIKTGSMNLAYLGRNFAVPEAKFIGVTMSDIKEFPFLDKLTIKAKDVDVKRAEEMMGYPWINRHKDWVKELKLVLKTKKKLEQDALQGQRLTFVGEYIKKKIDNKEWLS